MDSEYGRYVRSLATVFHNLGTKYIDEININAGKRDTDIGINNKEIIKSLTQAYHQTVLKTFTKSYEQAESIYKELVKDLNKD